VSRKAGIAIWLPESTYTVATVLRMRTRYKTTGPAFNLQTTSRNPKIPWHHPLLEQSRLRRCKVDIFKPSLLSSKWSGANGRTLSSFGDTDLFAPESCGTSRVEQLAYVYTGARCSSAIISITNTRIGIHPDQIHGGASLTRQRTCIIGSENEQKRDSLRYKRPPVVTWVYT